MLGSGAHPSVGLKTLDNNYPHGVLELAYGYTGTYLNKVPRNDMQYHINKKVVIDSYGDSYFNGGNVGIGTTAPETKLHIKSDDYNKFIFLDKDW